MTEHAPSFLFVNGRFCSEDEPVLSALDRGVTLGDGLFETMLASQGHIFRLGQHLARLRRGATVLQLPLAPEYELLSSLEQVISRLPVGRFVVRLTVTRGPDKGRGVALPPTSTPTVAVRAVPLSPYPGELYEKGFRVLIGSVRRNEGSPLSCVKSLNYGDSILARKEAQERGYDDAIMLNNKGEVACTSVANLFVVRDGQMWTPPEESGVLSGITRACILELASSLGVPAQAQPFGTELLFQASEVFLCNTVIGVMPVTGLEGCTSLARCPGPVTQRLAGAYQALVAGELSP